MDRYLLHLGRNYEWLSRCDASTDAHSLYQEQIVCSRCYRLYTEMQALLAFQGKFMKKLSLGTVTGGLSSGCNGNGGNTGTNNNGSTLNTNNNSSLTIRNTVRNSSTTTRGFNPNATSTP